MGDAAPIGRAVALEALALAAAGGAYAVEYFAKVRLGMNRWVNYHVMAWNRDLPTDAIVWVVAAALVLSVATMATLIATGRVRACLPTLGFLGIAVLYAGAFVACAFGVVALRASLVTLAVLAAGALSSVLAAGFCMSAMRTPR